MFDSRSATAGLVRALPEREVRHVVVRHLEVAAAEGQRVAAVGADAGASGVVHGALRNLSEQRGM